jgi:microcystin degradation protein MlrC
MTPPHSGARIFAMRIAMAGFSHETNTYCPAPTELPDFVRWRDGKIADEAAGTSTVWGGFVDRAHDIGAEPLTTYSADAVPSGTISAEAYAVIRSEMLAALRAAEPFDAVALNLHGAAVVEGLDDAEGDLCAAVRTLAGRRPLGAVFDLHGNLTQSMCDQLDVAFGYRTYPHVDTKERGAECIDALAALVRGAPRRSIYLATAPMLLPSTNTFHGPGLAANRVCDRVEARDGVFDCTLMHGFPYADVEIANLSVMCTALDDFTAREGAEYVTKWMWAHRDEFRRETLDPPAAVRRALDIVAANGGPVVINETDDNPGGGAPGDGTQLLRALLEADRPPGTIVFGFVWDPETARRAHEAGVGANIDVALGAKHDGLHGVPIEQRAEVRALSDGRWTLKELGKGQRVNLRAMACLRIDGVDVVVSSRRQQTFDDGPFEIHGLDFTDYELVGLKSTNHFRAFYESRAAAIVTSDGGGLTTERLDAFVRVRDKRALWPLASVTADRAPDTR